MGMDGPSAMDVVTHTGAGRGWSSGHSDRSAVSRLAPAQPGVNTRSRRMFESASAMYDRQPNYSHAGGTASKRRAEKGLGSRVRHFSVGGKGGAAQSSRAIWGQCATEKKTKRKSRQSVSELSFKNEWVCAVHSHCRTALMGYETLRRGCLAKQPWWAVAVQKKEKDAKDAEEPRGAWTSLGRPSPSRPGCHVMYEKKSKIKRLVLPMSLTRNLDHSFFFHVSVVFPVHASLVFRGSRIPDPGGKMHEAQRHASGASSRGPIELEDELRRVRYYM